MNELYRSNVALIVRNSDGLILAGERRDIPGNWQLPQGGVDDGESFEMAAWRELLEETGLIKESLRLIQQSAPVSYRFPDHAQGWRGFVGQQQRYFLLDLIDSTVKPVPSDEFSGWLWLSVKEVYKRIVDFKKSAYKQAFTDIFGEGWNVD
ncbi:RNA pyrophosphohydrolase [bacterium]|nr:RNA pyrophosphohydrolase [bacterium]